MEQKQYVCEKCGCTSYLHDQFQATGGSFADVPAGTWYTDAVTWAVSNQITEGTGGNRFSPEAAVTRAQAVTFLYRELG